MEALLPKLEAGDEGRADTAGRGARDVGGRALGMDEVEEVQLTAEDVAVRLMVEVVTTEMV